MNWDGIIIALIAAFFGAVPPTIAAIAAFRKVKQVHVEVNSRMDQLLKATERASHAAGVTEQQEWQRVEDMARDVEAARKAAGEGYPEEKG